jgi:hypothetical protein
MYVAWIVSPITLYAFLALALLACLVLFVSLKLEIAVAQRSSAQSRREAMASAATLTAQLAALRQEIESTEAPSFAGLELNLNRRAQALRMHRRGEAPATIAAALRVSRNEIDLLLKIQKLAARDGLEQAPSGN